MATLFCRT